MKSLERVVSALARTGYDRIPVRHLGTPEIDEVLRRHFHVETQEELLERVGDDFRGVDAHYIGPKLETFPDGSWEGLNGERYKNIPFGDGAYPEAVYLPFAEVEHVSELARHRFPEASHFDYSRIPRLCERYRDYALIYGNAGVLDFINGLGRCRGIEKVFFDIGTENPVFLELVERRFRFEYEKAERVLKAAKGRVLILYCGEDLGCQLGPIISPQAFDRLFADKYRRLFALARQYGARTMMHSCGSVRTFLPRLIELGLNILDVVQVAAQGMELVKLQQDFGDALAFCGSMCVQSILPTCTVEEVRREVDRRLRLFAEGGLILGPSHAIQVRTPLENILAMYRQAGSLKDN